MKIKVFIMCVLFAICCSGCGAKTEIPKESVDTETTKAVDTGMAMKIETPEGDIIVEVTKDTEATETTETTEPHWKPKVWEEGNRNPEILVERFFEISESEYEVAEVHNELKEVYGGSYRVVLNVKKEDMPQFIEELEKCMGEPIDKASYELYSVLGKKIKGEELKAEDVLYEKVSPLLRECDNSFWMPNNASLCAMYSGGDAEVYKITLCYSE